MKSRASSTERTPRSPIYLRNFGEFKSRKINSASPAESISLRINRSVSTIFTGGRLSAKGGDLARLAEHLVDLVEVRLFEQDHLTRVLLECDILSLGKSEQFIINVEGRTLLFETL